MSDAETMTGSSALAKWQHRYDVAMTVATMAIALTVTAWAAQVADPPFGLPRMLGAAAILCGILGAHLLHLDEGRARGSNRGEVDKVAPRRFDPKFPLLLVRLALLLPLAIEIPAADHRDVSRDDLRRVAGIVIDSGERGCGRGCGVEVYATLRTTASNGSADSLRVEVRGFTPAAADYLERRLRIGDSAVASVLTPHGVPWRLREATAYEIVQGRDTMVSFEHRVAVDRYRRGYESGELFFLVSIVAMILLLAGVNQAALRHPLFAAWNHPAAPLAPDSGLRFHVPSSERLGQEVGRTDSSRQS